MQLRRDDESRRDRGRRQRRRPARRVLARGHAGPRPVDRAGARHRRARRLDRDARATTARPCACACRSRCRGSSCSELGRRASARAADLRSWSAVQPLRSRRRSSSVRPPQTPASWLVASANSRHSPVTGHWLAHALRRVDLVERDAGGADREEQFGTRVAARGAVAPLVGVPVVGANPRQRHFVPPSWVAQHCGSCAPDHMRVRSPLPGTPAARIGRVTAVRTTAQGS